jgi:hypothetical protein
LPSTRCLVAGTSRADPEPFRPTKKQIAEFDELGKTPPVTALRRALSAYANGKPAPAGAGGIPRAVGRSPLMVLAINRAIFGGYDLHVVFRDQRDAIYYAWVYRRSAQEWQLRALGRETCTPGEMRFVQKRYGRLIDQYSL